MDILVWGAGVAAALILNGCNSESEEPAVPLSVDDTADLEQFEKQLAWSRWNGPTIPYEPIPYRLDVQKNTSIFQSFQKLLKSGVKVSHLDTGCKDEKEGKAADHNIAACEVIEFSLGHYTKYPLAAQALAGGPLPWTFDGTVDQKEASLQIKFRIRDAIEFLEKGPLKGLDPDSDSYKEKLAFALFYFANFPKDPNKTTPDIANVSDQDLTLGAHGLAEFQNYLSEHGGLGTENLQSRKLALGDSALDALTKRRGADTDITKSNILFAVFAEAGLSPEFHTVPLKEITPHEEEKIFVGPHHNVYKGWHRIVGLTLGNKTHYFDLTTMAPPKELPNAKPMDLTKALGLHLMIRGEDILFHSNKYAKAALAFQRALEVFSKNAALYHVLGKSYALQNKSEAATEAFKKALEINPDHAWSLDDLGDQMWKKGGSYDRHKALWHYLQAAKANPERMIPNQGRKYLSRARSHYAALKRVGKTPPDDLIDFSEYFADLLKDHRSKNK